ncbi:MAG: hypothetical protein OIF50_14835, partial [Flavobacteriaceae bacterium]|nr:hypothetical protein [Flavobacteriaceae bacterium]
AYAKDIRLAVYPKIGFEFNFYFNSDQALYYKSSDSLKDYYASYHEGKDAFGRPLQTTSNSRRRKEIIDKEITNILGRHLKREWKFKLGVNCEVDGQDKLQITKLFEHKFRGQLSPLLWIYDFIDDSFGVSDAKEIAASVKKKKAGGWNKLKNRFNANPMSFELLPPSIAVGIGIGYNQAQNGILTYTLNGKLLMNPIIGAQIKLDLLALGSKFKPWGVIIDALDIISFAADLFSGGAVALDYKIDLTFESSILLVGADSTDGKTTPATITWDVTNNRVVDANMAIQGRLKGTILMEFGIKLRSKVKDGKSYKKNEVRQKIEKRKEEGGFGVKMEGDSEIHLTLGADKHAA